MPAAKLSIAAALIAVIFGTVAPAQACQTEREASRRTAVTSVEVPAAALKPLLGALECAGIQLARPVVAASVERIPCRCPHRTWVVELRDGTGEVLATIHSHGTTRIAAGGLSIEAPRAVAAEVEALIAAARATVDVDVEIRCHGDAAAAK
jgi:hypothetical protein